MTLPDVTLPCFFLQPGQLYFVRNPAILQTLLGSCVGVTFWSRRYSAGALCHGILPRCPPHWPASEVPGGGRYVDFSIRYLARRFDAIGVRRQDVEVKVFGGADVLPVPAASNKPTIGALNCQAASGALEQEGFRVLASDVRGDCGRRIQFHTGTGEVLVQRLGMEV